MKLIALLSVVLSSSFAMAAKPGQTKVLTNAALVQVSSYTEAFGLGYKTQEHVQTALNNLCKDQGKTLTMVMLNTDKNSTFDYVGLCE